MLSGLLKQEQPNVKILVNGAGYGKTGAAGTIPGALSTGMVRLNDEALVAVTEWYFRISQGTKWIISCLRSGVYAAAGIRGLRRVKVAVLSYSRALAAELKRGRSM